ncbi:MAG: RecQ family ATP-dependent DNA helicase [Sulfuricurvum sp.]|uniref:RecQ family ATP-dependent DNA helicase n=1 Tax=Sulfuricurvum sp. TaxID=2025608 RepID=UPI0025F82786|nr:RecQ family ATP-dependent DNA helicase [Sulfuricurvum sp.]MBV5320966.1 RecQ family ATP-dependent DNA helicase [Sulfuricurvum sp.]
MNREEAELKLKQIFGFDHFFDDQWKTIDRILQKKRVLLIEKTGFGKSLTFQFPATQFDGLTIIFSPLIALMRDQIKSLNEKGIKVGLINSGETDDENNLTIQKAINNELKILYIAPERQENSIWQESVSKMNVSFVVVDEAHCISSWGHDFRPAFRRIINLMQILPANIPVLATTATATITVAQDIKNQIGGDIELIRGDLLRENLKLNVIHVNSEEEKMAWISNYLERIDGNGIVYTGTRSNAEIFSKWCESENLNTIYYHGGLDSNSRKSVEKEWMNNKFKAVISTNALGMGIDKSDIRFIIHTQITQSPIHYYQEIGRAGRDGKTAEIFLLFNPNDTELPLSFINGARPSFEKYGKVINALKQESLGEKNVEKKTNLTKKQVTTILADLIDQKIIIKNKNKKYEYLYNAPQLDFSSFEVLRNHRLEEFNKMLEYIDTDQCKMLYLCNYLGDTNFDNCEICDSCLHNKNQFSMSENDNEKIKRFQENYFPVLDVSIKKTKLKEKYIIKYVKDKEYDVSLNNQLLSDSEYVRLSLVDKKIFDELMLEAYSELRLINGVASSYYGFSNVGVIIHKCKYENGGDYPIILLQQTLRAFGKTFKEQKFDLIMFVPPTKSGKLVENFANKIASTLKLPIASLIKIKETKEQKIFQNGALKTENIKDAFWTDTDVNGLSILLIDDIFDSGATMKEIGKMLTKKGARVIAPLVIAKTVGGDIEN